MPLYRTAFFQALTVFLVIAAFGNPMSAQVSYDKISFVGENNGVGANQQRWTQLSFIVTGLRVGGRCYLERCMASFTLDSHIGGSQRADIGITGRGSAGGTYTVRSEFPYHNDRWRNAFIGPGLNATNDRALRAAVGRFTPEERLVIAWIAVNSTALIDYALASDRVGSSERAWRQTRQYFTRSVRSGLTVLREELALLDQRNRHSSATWRSWQEKLQALGYYEGAIDGVFGPMTRSALHAFQADNDRLQRDTLDIVGIRLLTEKHDARLASADSQSDTAQLREGSSSSTSSEPTLAELRRDNRALQARINVLQGIVDNLRAREGGASARADAELTQLRSEVPNLRRRVEGQQRTISTLRERLEAAQQSADDLAEQQSELEDAKRQLSAANETIADLRQEVVTLRPLREQLGEAEGRIASLIAELEELGITPDELASINAELADANRRLDAANETIADLRQEVGQLRPLRADLSEEQDTVAELRRQLAAANATIVDLRDGIENDERLIAVRRQLDASNQVATELREQMVNEHVPLTEHETVERRLEASSQTIAELRERMENDFVPINTAIELQRRLDAANQTNADLRSTIANSYVPIEDYWQQERQITALNQTLLELHDRNERQQRRMVEAETLFRNFREDCMEAPECARLMMLDER